MFTVHSRGVFTQDKSGYFSNSKVYRKKWDRESVHYRGVFTNQGCSLRGFTVLLLLLRKVAETWTMRKAERKKVDTIEM